MLFILFYIVSINVYMLYVVSLNYITIFINNKKTKPHFTISFIFDNLSYNLSVHNDLLLPKCKIYK